MNKVLTIIPSVSVWYKGDSLLFDRKFYDGMLIYKKEWLGTISCIIRKSNDLLPSFGYIEKKEDEIPFQIIVVEENEPIESDFLKNASVVLASGDACDQLHISALCKKNQIKCVYIIEYIPETRHQIINLARAINPIVKLRRHLFIKNSERKREAAFLLADGIQANGAGAYNRYNRFKNCIMYFDTRVNTRLVISDEELNKRLATLSQKRPLQLAFSGRLIKMKGADSLIELASLLQQRNIDFQMTIYGTGEIESEMKDKVNKMQVASKVKMVGAVDFYKQLIPEIKANIDLYVILHKQSDPSCTYLETLSCGIPIVGYKNKAFSGLLNLADIGWGKQINDLHGIADVIENVDKNRDLIKQKSIKCANFARLHDFESTFQKRINHLEQLMAK